MTPKQYIKIKREEDKKIEECLNKIHAALELAKKTTFPKYVRPATPKDIIEGNIIWHKEGDEGPFWNVVDEVLKPNDPWKAYYAEDGCRYGLEDAYIDIEEEQWKK